MSLARRHRLLALAETCDALILEDDPYGLLHYDAPPPPSLYTLDGGRGRVIAVRSFSKILAPGLRAGWIMAPAAVIRAFVAARQGMDTCTNVLGQRMIAAYLRGGALAAHLARLRAAYRDRRDAMLAALDRQFGDVRGCALDQAGRRRLPVADPGAGRERRCAGRRRAGGRRGLRARFGVRRPGRA